MFRGLVTLIFAASVLAGCASLDEMEAEFTNNYSANTYNGPDVSEGDPEKLKWIGHNASEMIEELGAPAQVISATLLGGPPSVALVYEDDLGGCTDAYVVVTDTEQVIKYFCR